MPFFEQLSIFLYLFLWALRNHPVQEFFVLLLFLRTSPFMLPCRVIYIINRIKLCSHDKSTLTSRRVGFYINETIKKARISRPIVTLLTQGLRIIHAIDNRTDKVISPCANDRTVVLGNTNRFYRSQTICYP